MILDAKLMQICRTTKGYAVNMLTFYFFTFTFLLIGTLHRLDDVFIIYIIYNKPYGLVG